MLRPSTVTEWYVVCEAIADSFGCAIALPDRPIAPEHFPASLTPRNETGDAGLHDRVEPDARPHPIADLANGVFGDGRDIKVLLDPAGVFRGGQWGGAALDRPGQDDLRRRLLDAPRDRGDDRIFQQVRLAAVPQRGEGL